MTATLPDTGSLEHLDFDPQLPCETTCLPCPEPATHRYIADPPCGHGAVYFYCTPHAYRVHELLKQPCLLVCYRCGWTHSGTLGDVARIEPL